MDRLGRRGEDKARRRRWAKHVARRRRERKRRTMRRGRTDTGAGRMQARCPRVHQCAGMGRNRMRALVEVRTARLVVEREECDISFAPQPAPNEQISLSSFLKNYTEWNATKSATKATDIGDNRTAISFTRTS